METPGIAYVDGRRLRRALVAACEYAQTQRGELNRINVFPVPDGDTGTNLALTVRAISDHLMRDRSASVGAVARAAADAAVLGARGNCGMMLSHFLIGFADAVRDRTRIRVADFGGALRSGVDHLYGALERPVEGTILTVMRASAEAARDCDAVDFVPLVEHVTARAREALARTPELLPVLARAGVVDAGAKGFVSLLDGALLFIHGDPLVSAGNGAGGDLAAVAHVEYREETYRFCTEALVRGDDLPSESEVRERLRDRGDSLIVLRSGDVLKVHVHTDDPERVFGYLRGVGRLVTHKAEDMVAQHDAVERAAATPGASVSGVARRPVSVVTDSAADLPEVVVRAHGIHVTPLLLVTDEETYRDGVDITAEEFHAMLGDEGETLPTTSQPAPADFLETFSRAAEEGEEVLAVVLGSALSGTYGSAEAAASRFDGAPVHVVDSRGASLLPGLLALKAAELVEAGMSASDAADRIRSIRDRSGILFTVDTFDRLLASGRVGRGRALLGNVLSVKPILGLDHEGRVLPVDKVLGRKRVLPAVRAALEERIPDGAPVRFGVVHVAAPEVVSPVEAMLRERWGEDAEILTAPATPVIATHLGAGAWGVAYMVEE